MSHPALDELEDALDAMTSAVWTATHALEKVAKLVHNEYHSDNMWAADWKRCFHPSCATLAEAQIKLKRI